MAGKTDLGGIFFKLGLDLDKNSFESGNKQINNASESMNKLIGTARNAAVALVSIKTIGKLGTLADAESSAYKTAEALGITTDSLNEWKAAAKIAGVDANSLVGSMGRLGNVLSHIEIDGSGLDEYSKKLQKLGMGITDLQDASGEWLSADSAFEKVIAKAQSDYAKASTDKEKLKITTIVGDILGGAGQDFFIALQNMGVSIADFKAGAGGTVWTNAQNNKDAMAFSKEMNTLKASMSSLATLLGDDVARELTPAIQGINNWLAQNGESLKLAFNKIAGVTGGIVDAAVNSHTGEDIVTATGVEGFIKDTKALFASEEELSQIWEADKERKAIQDQLIKENEKKNGWIGANIQKKKISFEELSPELQSRMLQFEANGGDLNYFRNSWVSAGALQDGIMRPDGTITQVAPDDWVFAARNVGDLAKAFIPPMPAMAGGNNEFVINQTFNINGSSDLPQVLRQQAYQGTQDGLMQIMEQSSQRLQLMSGTR